MPSASSSETITSLLADLRDTQREMLELQKASAERQKTAIEQQALAQANARRTQRLFLAVFVLAMLGILFLR